MRPQVLLPYLLTLVWLAMRRNRIPAISRVKLAALGLPVAVVVSFSSIRNRVVTGEWHLISANDAVGRFFADTEYRRIVENLRRRWVITYTSTDSTRDGAWRQLSVRVVGRSATARTKMGYFGAKAS